MVVPSREQWPSLRASGGQTLTSHTQPIGETSSDGSRFIDVLFEIDLETGGVSWETLQVLQVQLPAVVARDFPERHGLPAMDVAVLQHAIEKSVKKHDPAPVGRDRRPYGDVRAAARGLGGPVDVGIEVGSGWREGGARRRMSIPDLMVGCGGAVDVV